MTQWRLAAAALAALPAPWHAMSLPHRRAARVYVSFEIPASQPTFAERTRLALTRLVYGHVPSAAICYGRPAPRMTGIAAGNDTDDTGESATIWFGDFRIEPR